MTLLRNLLGTNASGDAPNVEDVFSTYLYDGASSAQTITNGIDLAGEGGMVWTKRRNVGGNRHCLSDTERGASSTIYSDTTDAEYVAANGNFGSFNSDGFTTGTYQNVNSSGNTYASWTFRKAPRFFDVITWTGDSVAGREIPHNLGVEPGMIMIKQTNTTSNWIVYHRSVGASSLGNLNLYNAFSADSNLNGTSPTSTHFTLSNYSPTNATGSTYVAYLFAHDPVGEDDDGMIACGSYSPNYPTEIDIDLGWEPQFVLVRASDSVSDWAIFDNMRGVATGGHDLSVYTNTAAGDLDGNRIDFTATGFRAVGGGTVTQGTGTRIYMAIRAPMMVEPEAGTDVFAVDTGEGSIPEFYAGFPVDMAFWQDKRSGYDNNLSTRLLGATSLFPVNTNAESGTGDATFDNMDYWWRSATGTNKTSWMFKRAKGFFDVVTDTRAFSYGTINHSLGVIPELIIKKDRSRASTYWDVMPNVSPYDYRYTIYLNDTQAISGPATLYWNTAPTDTTIGVNYSSDGSLMGDDFIYYLFATLDGVSKVGSYTGNGSNQNIACGFSAGARFVLIKRTDSTGDWYIWDTERGIVTGNDPHLSLNTTAAVVTSDDSIDPQSDGFTVNQVSATNINVTSATYIFLAIA